MDGKPLRIQPADLYAQLGTANAPGLHGDAAFADDERRRIGTISRTPGTWLRSHVRRGAACGLGIIALLAGSASGFGEGTTPPLLLQAKIPLGEVRGRIDHMAVDLQRSRLFVAELGNDSVGVVDMARRAVVHRISGLHEPQGVAHVPSTDTLYVANAGDGTVRLYDAETFAPTGEIALGSDADNIRLDAAHNQVLVGYGSGALAVIDPASRRKVADIPLPAHPESFQLDRGGNHIYVNLPDARAIAAVDRSNAVQIAKWATEGARSNFPMALEPDGERLFVVFRSPPKLAVLSTRDGGRLGFVDTCGDADDVFVDPKRGRVYVSCGAGAIDVFGLAEGYPHIDRIVTVAGARTALFVPTLDILAVAVRAAGREPPALWLYKPVP